MAISKGDDYDYLLKGSNVTYYT